MDTDISESVIGFDALYASADKCRKGVLWKDSAARYYLNSIEETLKLERELKSGKYRAKPPIKFKVMHPKERDITSIAFRDRVYQRSLNDNILYPTMMRSFVADNAACQKGKGTDYARKRLIGFLREYWHKNGSDGYVLQIDIKGYYKSMQHAVVYKQFDRRLDRWSYARTVEVLSGQYAGDVGFDPGSQMVQIAGIAFLDELDHYIKERLRIRYYIRYMDDLMLIHKDAEHLQYCRKGIGERLADIGMQMHQKKTKIYPISEGIIFLGFVFRLSRSGKVTMLLKPENVKAERKKLRRLVGLAKKGKITKEKADECYRGWRAHAAKGDSANLLVRMDQYYKSLWEEGET